MNDEQKRLLLSAIETMRDACDDAEECINRDEISAIYAASRVMHCLTWGNANAYSSIESVLRLVDRQIEREKIKSVS